MKNASPVSFFTLSGLEDETKEMKLVLFSVVSVCYFLIVLINVTLIVVIVQEKSLHEPMFAFLCNLCINALYGTTGFYPKFLTDLLTGNHVISYEGCLLQAFVIHSNILCDFSILTVMAYDRYVAICRPLEYHSIMTKQVIVKLTAFPWIPPLLCEGVIIFLTYRLTLCGSRIKKLYCVNWPIVKLSCFSTIANNVVAYTVIMLYVLHLCFIVYSYLKLIRTCLKSAESGHKFMQTCMPHLLSLANVTIAIFFDVMYSRYGTSNIPSGPRNFLALEFLVTPPLLNPIIYGVQLTKLRQTLLRVKERANFLNNGRKVTFKL